MERFVNGVHWIWLGCWKAVMDKLTHCMCVCVCGLKVGAEVPETNVARGRVPATCADC